MPIMTVEYVNVIFTESFDFCIDNFFPERKNEVLGEILRFIKKPRELPKPKECGTYKIRTKEWLPITNTFAYYWNLGRVWVFFGIVENGNDTQLEELGNIIDKLKSE